MKYPKFPDIHKMRFPDKKSLKYLFWIFTSGTIFWILFIHYIGYGHRGLPGGSFIKYSWVEINNELPLILFSMTLISIFVSYSLSTYDRIIEKKDSELLNRYKKREEDERYKFGDLISAKFHVDKNAVVATTKYVVEDLKPITIVKRDLMDNSWQFLSEDFVRDFTIDTRIVSIEDIVNLDPTLIEICDLPSGSIAYRSEKTDNWIIKN